ncbi:hypothetical protein ACIOD2_49495 [Amycolatopsis sp. NPDC088138]|uniref:hypothetical protein n=1 Tax=Amycolatopsis sp. NPDC088138 TaxID=3363938 RepID=UPI0037F2CB30
MTLHAETPSDSSPMPGEPGLPALILRRNKPPRVSLWYWLRYPRRAWWITQLIREAFRWRGESNTRPEALTLAERAVCKHAHQAQRAEIARIVKRIDGLADRYQALRADAARERRLARIERDRRLAPAVPVPVYVAGPVSVKRAKKVIVQCQRKIEEDTGRGYTRHQDRPSTARDVATSSPLVVDILALMAVIAKILNVNLETASIKIPETVTTVGFSLLGALVLALLAHSTGNAAWHLRSVSGRLTAEDEEEDPPEVRREPEFPNPKNLLYVKAGSLFAVSLTTAISIATRIIHPTSTFHAGPVEWMVGIGLGIFAFLAPWLIVWNRMRSGSLEVRTIESLTKLVRDAEAVVTGHEKAAVEADERAAKVRQSADRSRLDELQAAMAPSGAAMQIIDLARSYHGQAGLHAIDENTPVEPPFVSTRSVLATDTSAIDEAMKRFDLPDDEEAPDEVEGEEGTD